MLLTACKYSNPEIVQFLIEDKGLSVYSKDKVKQFHGFKQCRFNVQLKIHSHSELGCHMFEASMQNSELCFKKSQTLQ